MENVVMYDVDGTITQEGEYSPKAQAIPQLEALAGSALELFVNSGALSAETAEKTLAEWETIRRAYIANPKYFKRFFMRAEDAENADELDQGMVVYESIKDVAPGFAKALSSLMISGIIKGSLPNVAYADAVTSIMRFAEKRYRIGTFSGGSKILQEVALSRVPVNLEVNENEYSNLAEIVGDSKIGAGCHDKKEFGSKLKPESYQKAAEHFKANGLNFYVWITDSPEEALQCKQGVPYVHSVFVDRKGMQEGDIAEISKQDITVVHDICDVPMLRE